MSDGNIAFSAAAVEAPATHSFPLLPDIFADLEPFVPAWSHATTAERWAAREKMSFDDITAFYNAMLPRASDIIKYLEQYPYEEIPEDCTHLVHLLLVLPHAGISVELHEQSRPPNTPYPHHLRLEKGPTRY